MTLSGMCSNRYEGGRHCDTLLTCPIHQGLILKVSASPSDDLSGRQCRRCGRGGVLRHGEV